MSSNQILILLPCQESLDFYIPLYAPPSYLPASVSMLTVYL